MSCTVPNCYTRSDKNDQHLSFHRFPTDPELRTRWIENVGKERSWSPTCNSRVCSLHFEESCYRTGYKNKILHSSAVPTIFPNQLLVKRISSRARAMVNYCCVKSCGKNSRRCPFLTYHSFPKEKDRCKEWLNIIDRNDLWYGKKYLNYRVCSQHFDPTLQLNKNRHLPSFAVPALFLTEDNSIDYVWVDNSENDDSSTQHAGFSCNNCNTDINGFRYTCMECDNYNLCQSCEMNRVHAEHCMLRIPTPDHLTAEEIQNKIRGKVKTQSDAFESSDDEPITKYAPNNDYNSLTHDTKKNIRRQIKKALEITLKMPSNAGNTERKRATSHSLTQKLDCSAIKKLKNEGVGDSVETEDIVKTEQETECVDIQFAEVNIRDNAIQYEQFVEVFNI